MRQTQVFYLLFLGAAMIWGCRTHAPELPEAMPAETYRSFTDDGAWCWFSDPRAIYYQGEFRRTYSGWVDSVGNIVVGSYDHDTGDIQTHILHEKLERDDHDNPSFMMDDDGKLMVFYSRHATGRSPVFLARAARSEDISEWTPVAQLRLNDTTRYAGYSDTYTYANIVRLSDEENKLYLFWRGADFKPNFSESADGGKTWSPGKIMVLPERIYRDRRPYMKVSSNNKDVIHFAFTDGHPNAEPTNSIYYLKYQRGALYKASGEKMMDWKDLPVDPSKADIVYDATSSRAKAWIWDVAENEEGNPVITYVKFPADTSHVYYYAVYDEGKWNNYELVNSGRWFPQTPDGAREREPNYSGGIALDHRDPSNIYLSREKNGVFEIEHWSTPDKGKTWTQRAITDNSTHDNVRPFVVRSSPADSSTLLWMNIQRYRHYTDYRSKIKMANF